VSDFRVQRADLQSPAARRLVDALNAELSAVYPEQGATHFRLDPEEVADGRGAFLLATRAGTPVGCGAVRRIAQGTGEIKRMYVVPAERGRGLGRALLTALEDEARSLGLSRLFLETGARQHAAVAMYERAGFSRVDPYGEYVGSPLSLCMKKDLEAL
jgi:putative acetyltransferase